MRKLVLEIDLRNAAFGDDIHSEGQEVARILRAYADKMENNLAVVDAVLFDINGNRCGAAYVNGGK